MKALVIIPARYGSTRLAGKVLLRRTGKYLVQHTYEQVTKARLVDRIIIATDDKRVLRAARDFGGEAVLTSRRLRSGTERVAEVAAKLSYHYIVNVQADEPEINPKYIDTVIRLLGTDKKAGMSSLACPFDKKVDIADPNKVKVVLDKHKYALYFSRSLISYQPQVKSATVLRHLGIYGYRKDVLLSLVRIPPSPLEKSEDL
ncbi:3-deoxy-manno-octulosonate cytidylyltransferase, partial [Planctomycetota bacterium]